MDDESSMFSGCSGLWAAGVLPLLDLVSQPVYDDLLEEGVGVKWRESFVLSSGGS